jgi:hypothetical protein
LKSTLSAAGWTTPLTSTTTCSASTARCLTTTAASSERLRSTEAPLTRRSSLPTSAHTRSSTRKSSRRSIRSSSRLSRSQQSSNRGTPGKPRILNRTDSSDSLSASSVDMRAELRIFSLEIRGFKVKSARLRNKTESRRVLSRDWKTILNSESPRLKTNCQRILT